MEIIQPELAYRDDEGLFHLSCNYDPRQTACGLMSKCDIIYHWRRILIKELDQAHACPLCFAAFKIIYPPGKQCGHHELPVNLRNDVENIAQISSLTTQALSACVENITIQFRAYGQHLTKAGRQ